MSQHIEVVRPSLHPSSPLIEILRVIVRSTALVPLIMSKLPLDGVGVPA
jgi:hypothetical protein